MDKKGRGMYEFQKIREHRIGFTGAVAGNADTGAGAGGNELAAIDNSRSTKLSL